MTSKQLMRLLLKKNRKSFLPAFILTAFTALIGFLSPALLAELMDHYLSDLPSRLPAFFNDWVASLMGPDFLRSNLWVFGGALVLVSVLSGVFSYHKGKLSAVGSESAALYLRQTLYSHIQSLPFDYHVKVETGDLLQRCTSDIDTVRRFLSMQLLAIVNAVLMVIIAVSLLLPISVQITLISLCITPIIFLFSLFFFRLVTDSFRAADEAEAKMSTVLQENLTGVRVVRAFGQAQSETLKFDMASSENLKRGFKVADREAIYWGVSSALGSIQMGIALLVCILQAMKGLISVGDLVVMTGYVGMLIWPIRQLGRILTDSSKSMVALERISEVLRAKPEPVEPNALRPSLKGDIVFEHVSFGYEKGRDILQDVSFRARAGQSIAILGPTGSGKSTLVHLLQRLYEPRSGSITIGDVPLHRIDRKYLRQRVGLVLQDSFLYSKTIRENVAVAVENAGQEDIESAAARAAAHDFITASEKGYDTLVGERGVTLSGGQKQRVAIARTLMKDSDILIFDDSLSAVDTRTDAHIREALLGGEKRTTTFIISHRVTTLSQADLILVLENGRITASGTHGELIRQDGLYARINAIQTGLEDRPEAAMAQGE
ncbi:MAG: ABC transporter ATP-binding protein [Christensenellales bacterium]